MLDLADTIFRLTFSFFLGGFIGLEREKKNRRPGLRTHILVCVGSTLIMLVSLYIYDTYKGEAPVDPARIAAGVVTGIGFLGAGTIIRSQERIKGLTTAASIWVSAGIGLAIGCGYTSAAVVTTILVFLTLSLLKKLETAMDKKAGSNIHD